MNASLRFGLGHALHAMAAGFEFQSRIDTIADDAGDDFLVAADLAGRLGNDFDLPAVALGKARVHAKQIAGEEGRFVAAGAAANFEEGVFFVVRVFRQQQLLQIDFECI